MILKKKLVLHLVESYSPSYSAAEIAMKTVFSSAKVENLQKLVHCETQKSLAEVIKEIKETKLLDHKTLGFISNIMNKVCDMKISILK